MHIHDVREDVRTYYCEIAQTKVRFYYQREYRVPEGGPKSDTPVLILR